jgi:hypothetical protein
MGDRAEVFGHIRDDCHSEYLNTLLRREGSNTVVLSDDELEDSGSVPSHY